MKTNEFGSHKDLIQRYEIQRDNDCKGFILTVFYKDGTEEAIFIKDEFAKTLTFGLAT